jgi:hypothetical protein
VVHRGDAVQHQQVQLPEQVHAMLHWLLPCQAFLLWLLSPSFLNCVDEVACLSSPPPACHEEGTSCVGISPLFMVLCNCVVPWLLQAALPTPMTSASSRAAAALAPVQQLPQGCAPLLWGQTLVAVSGSQAASVGWSGSSQLWAALLMIMVRT